MYELRKVTQDTIDAVERYGDSLKILGPRQIDVVDTSKPLSHATPKVASCQEGSSYLIHKTKFAALNNLSNRLIVVHWR